jgi:hypothetical protein
MKVSTCSRCCCTVNNGYHDTVKTSCGEPRSVRAATHWCFCLYVAWHTVSLDCAVRMRWSADAKVVVCAVQTHAVIIRCHWLLHALPPPLHAPLLVSVDCCAQASHLSASCLLLPARCCTPQRLSMRRCVTFKKPIAQQAYGQHCRTLLLCLHALHMSSKAAPCQLLESWCCTENSRRQQRVKCGVCFTPTHALLFSGASNVM